MRRRKTPARSKSFSGSDEYFEFSGKAPRLSSGSGCGGVNMSWSQDFSTQLEAINPSQQARTVSYFSWD